MEGVGWGGRVGVKWLLGRMQVESQLNASCAAGAVVWQGVHNMGVVGGGVVEWWSGGVVGWWSGGVVEWWSGMVEWWSGGEEEWWSGGVVEWWSGGEEEWWCNGMAQLRAAPCVVLKNPGPPVCCTQESRTPRAI